jgi:hypothetical protein
LYNFLQHYDGTALVHRKLTELAEQLVVWYARSSMEVESSSRAWCWFGNTLTYANAKMPQALLLAHGIMGAAHFRHVGLASIDFLLAETYSTGTLISLAIRAGIAAVGHAPS